VSIGQGQVSLTPVSMAVYMATIANGGLRVTPHLVQAEDTGGGWVPVKAPEPDSTVQMSPTAIQAIHDGMWLVVNGGGTAPMARIEGHDVCGKTGTAQVISNKGRAAAGMHRKDLFDNGWFVFFAPRDHPLIAGVVFAEHVEHGTNAAIIAKHMLATFFAKQDRKPLPVFTPPGSPPPTVPEEVPADPDVRPPVADASGSPVGGQ
jgi:penicillin-binding protein 2